VGFVGLFMMLAGRRAMVILSGRADNRFGGLVQRLATMPQLVLGTARVNRPRYWYSGLLHTFIFWGFIVLQIRTLNFILNGINEDISLESLLGPVYDVFLPIMDLFNVLVIVGVGLAALQRLFWRPPRLTLNWDAWLILFMIWWLMVTDVMTNSFDIFLERGDNDYLSFFAFGLANLWDTIGMSVDTGEALHTAFWYLHLIDFLAFLAYLPVSKHSHILTSPLNVFFRRLQPTGVLQPIPNIEEREVFGVGKVKDFSWKQMMDFYTCTECGRCEINCPAFLTGKELSPKKIMHDMRAVVEATVGPASAVLPIAGKNGDGHLEVPSLIDAVGFNPIWDCVNCGACQQQCPVFIEHIPAIMDMRRYLVMDEANMPETAAAALMQLEQRGHPWRGTPLTRTSWMEGLDFEVPKFDGTQEYLYWVGCTGALVERNVKSTQALARLLHEAGVSFGCLGEEETCSGDPARRLGNEYLYQIQAGQTIEVWKAGQVQKVITNCPHCFNTMKNEYPQFDGNFEVLHHTQVLAQLIDEGKLRPNHELAEKVAYHDSCFLGRHNGIYEEPRDVIRALPQAELLELPRCKENGFCCGAGGSHMWVEESKGRRINHARMDEARACGAGAIAANCPFCIQMIEDGIPSVEPDEAKRMTAYEVAELLERAVLGGPAKPAGNGAAADAVAPPAGTDGADASGSQPA
jgi:Fe-S oxidoreductase